MNLGRELRIRAIGQDCGEKNLSRDIINSYSYLCHNPRRLWFLTNLYGDKCLQLGGECLTGGGAGKSGERGTRRERKEVPLAVHTYGVYGTIP